MEVFNFCLLLIIGKYKLLPLNPIISLQRSCRDLNLTQITSFTANGYSHEGVNSADFLSSTLTAKVKF